MKKSIILILLTFSFNGITQAQSTSKREVKKITNEINKNIDKLDKAIENADWSALEGLLEKTISIIDKNADAFVKVVEDIDLQQVVRTIEKVGENIDNNVDIIKLEKTADQIGKKVEEALEKKSHYLDNR